MKIPQGVENIIKILEKAEFEAYLVGGCVRDILNGIEPKDWDIATSAKPDQVQKLFPDNVYENQFGTVGVKTDSENLNLRLIEVTTFRVEGKYSDKRHPDEIKFAKTIEEDLARRDFTINAIAASSNLKLIDPFSGQADLKNKIIKAVGDPKERFNEDALRMMRAVRFAAVLNFKIEEKTREAIKKNSNLLQIIAKERIRDELIKIIESARAKEGLELLSDLRLLKFVLPELEEGINVGQNKHHVYTVWEHNLRALDYAAKQNYGLETRFASLLHDVGKPQSKRGEGPDSTFYGHEMIGAKMATRILERLKFSKKQIEKISLLIRYHLFYYNVDEVTEASVRRLLGKVGPENVEDLINVRKADRIGSGVPKAEPFKLRHLRYVIEKVSRDPLSVKMLLVKGEDVMKTLNIGPGPIIGFILNILLGEALDDPALNRQDYLTHRIEELGGKSDAELKKMAKEAEKEREEVQFKIEETSKQRYWVT
ncbi:MAG: HD domain-containing protein [Parcubacteria group bacterium]|nr:HD domain-containing protein [Parcubacteria group bacterium]